jgi:hypothetical protein
VLKLLGLQPDNPIALKTNAAPQNADLKEIMTSPKFVFRSDGNLTKLRERRDVTEMNIGQGS